MRRTGDGQTGRRQLIRRARRIAVLALWLLVVAPVAQAVQPGDPAPEWDLTDGSGQDVFFPAHAQGSPSIMFFWATWCPYCHAVMPYLKQIQDDYQDADVRVYAINFKDDGDPIEHMAELGYPFLVLPLGDLVADDYGVWGAPGLIVVDGEGVVAYRRGDTRAPPGQKIAELWDAELRGALDKVLGR